VSDQPPGINPTLTIARHRVYSADYVGEGIRTDRTLRWFAHLYRYAVAVSLNPTKMIKQTFRLKRSTTVNGSARRQAVYLVRAGPRSRD
jgi:hypothetical protein